MTDADNSSMLTILKELRTDVKQHQSPLLQQIDAERRHMRRFSDVEGRFSDIERRINDLVPELELMLKGELMGRLTHFETQIDHRFDQLAARIDAATATAPR